MKLLMNRIWDVVKSEQMLSAGDRVIVGFSGGADSVCLLFALQEIAKEIPLTLYAVHVNHGIRQEEAERDAAFCEKLCKEFKIEFTLIKADVMEIAKTRKISVEEAGRMVRYQAFWQKEELLYQENPHIPVKIAVAHHKNDQAETVLFRLARGTGLQGLSGINPVNGRIIRPLYNMTKEEIYQMVQKNQLAYVEDSSNQGNHYTRNKIRNQIIPLLESEICSQAVDHIATTASLLREADEYLKEQARIDAKKCVKQDGNGVTIQIPYFLERKTIIQKYLLLQILEELSPGRIDIGQVHVEDIRSLFEKQSGKEIQLPHQLLAKRNFNTIKIYHAEENPSQQESIHLVLHKSVGESNYSLPDGKTLQITDFDYDQKQIIPENTYTKWFDYDKILGVLAVRNPMEGDYLVYHKNQSRKLLKEYLKQEKIPADLRKTIYVIADDNHILWVPGYRMSEHYKVDCSTKRILQIQIR